MDFISEPNFIISISSGTFTIGICIFMIVLGMMRIGKIWSQFGKFEFNPVVFSQPFFELENKQDENPKDEMCELLNGAMRYTHIAGSETP